MAGGAICLTACHGPVKTSTVFSLSRQSLITSSPFYSISDIYKLNAEKCTLLHRPVSVLSINKHGHETILVESSAVISIFLLTLILHIFSTAAANYSLQKSVVHVLKHLKRTREARHGGTNL